MNKDHWLCDNPKAAGWMHFVFCIKLHHLLSLVAGDFSARLLKSYVHWRLQSWMHIACKQDDHSAIGNWKQVSWHCFLKGCSESGLEGKAGTKSKRAVGSQLPQLNPPFSSTETLLGKLSKEHQGIKSFKMSDWATKIQEDNQRERPTHFSLCGSRLVFFTEIEWFDIISKCACVFLDIEHCCGRKKPKNCLDLFPLSSVVFEHLILRRPISYLEGCVPAFHCSELCVRQQCCEQKWCVQLIWRHCFVLLFLLASSTCCRDHGGPENFRDGKISHKKWPFGYQWWSPFSPGKRNNYPFIKIWYY